MQDFLAVKFEKYRADNHLSDGMGVIVFLLTPFGEWCATAGLPEGAGADSHYRIASVSKTFTAAAILLLDQWGKLRIDDKLNDCIPGTDVFYLADSPNFAIPNKEQISIRDLLSHRAGVFDVFNMPVNKEPYNQYPYAEYIKQVLKEPDHQFTQDEIIAFLSANKLQLKDEERVNGYRYSDTGYTILSKIIERVSGKSYDRFLAENFFIPMGLKGTTAPWSAYDDELPSPFLKGSVRLTSTDEFEDSTEGNMSDQVGPGNIISTPRDITHWMWQLLSGRGPLSKEQVVKMTTIPEGNTSYALGIGSSEAGKGHSGAHPGYLNLVTYRSEEDVAIAVVTPFADYSKLHEHLAFLTGVSKGVCEIAKEFAGSRQE